MCRSQFNHGRMTQNVFEGRHVCQIQLQPCGDCFTSISLWVSPDLAFYAVQLHTFLGIIDATKNLTLATLNATANTPALEGPPVLGLTASIGGGPGGPGGGGPEGPGGGGPGRSGPPFRGPPPQFEALGCSDQGFRSTSDLMNQGFNRAVATTGYDESLFSFVGCRCDAGYNNIYTIGETGVVSRLALFCVYLNKSYVCCSCLCLLCVSGDSDNKLAHSTLLSACHLQHSMLHMHV